MRTQPRPSRWRIGLNGLSLIEVAPLVKLLKQPPKRLDILGVIGHVGTIEVDPIPHLLGELPPLVGVFHHLRAAGLVILLDRDLLPYILLRDTEQRFHAQLHRQPMGIPPRLTFHTKALLRTITANGILDGTCHNVVDPWEAISRRRSLKEYIRGRALANRQTRFKRVNRVPTDERFLGYLREVQGGVLSVLLHRSICDSSRRQR